MPTRVALALASLTLAGTLISAQSGVGDPDRQAQQEAPAFKFRTGVELINVNATVADQSGRFVSGLTREDFRVFDDEQVQPVTHFSAERVPVSLGIVLDTSGSMDGDKIRAAWSATRCRGCSRAAARRSTTRSPKRCSWRSRGTTARRRS